MPSFWQTESLFSNKKRWKPGKRLRRPRKEQETSLAWRRGMKRKSRRRSSTSELRTSKREWWVRITIWFPSSATRRRNVFKRLWCFRRRRTLNNLGWSSNRMSLSKDKTITDSNKRIEWRTRLVSNLKDLLVWRSMRRDAVNKWCHARITKRNVLKKTIWETVKWMRLPKWKSLRWSSLSASRTPRLSKRKLT